MSTDPAAVMIRPEPTPNPASVRFVVDRIFMEKGGADFTSPAAAGRSPLAQRLFALDGVAGVFVGSNFVTVTALPGASWESLASSVQKAISEHVVSGEPAVVGSGDLSADSGDDVAQGIIRVIEEEIRPAVAMDGGDVVFDSYEEGIVRLFLRGACAGCPSSVMTLKMGIERRLKEEFPQIVSVEAVR